MALMSLKLAGKVHRLTAGLLVAFVAVHLVNHLVGLSGAEAHIAFMHSLRVIYRHPLAETVLLLAVVGQMLSGFGLVARRWKQRRGVVAALQAVSGLYLAVFLLNHVGAVLVARSVLRLDTNFYFAAAGFHVWPFQFFFAPYYTLGVLAVFTHLGCALYWRLSGSSRSTRSLALALPVGVGLVVALLIVCCLAGMLGPVEIPDAYKAMFSFR